MRSRKGLGRSRIHQSAQESVTALKNLSKRSRRVPNAQESKSALKKVPPAPKVH
ncbi:hypothetical protein NSQ43_03380 [Sporosarcina sp. FSL W8-0480]|uniref:hypothetical protein n=1 Tax=Sporosarcina sp. FSL W8-0480 TaxID=2954701 RepID=UPI0030D9322A